MRDAGGRVLRIDGVGAGCVGGVVGRLLGDELGVSDGLVVIGVLVGAEMTPAPGPLPEE